MNRNVESHFSEVPSVDIERSTFDMSKGYLTAFDAGELIPFFIQEVIPGDTFNVTTSCVIRLQTPLTPIMSSMYLDTYYFYVPMRIIWDHFKRFMGEPENNPWLPIPITSVPQIIPPSGGWNVGTLADYFGLPVGKDSSPDASGNVSNTFSQLPFRAYCAIVSEWFRDENLQYAPIYNPQSDSNITGVNTGDQITDIVKGGAPFIAAKYHDYFTSCLPNVQRSYGEVGLWGNQIGPSGSNLEKLVPVYPTSESNNTSTTDAVALKLRSVSASTEKTLRGSSGANDLIWSATAISGYTPATTTNLWANVGAMSLSINELRLAFQLQKYYEKLALYGARYREQLKALYGVTSSDARMQIPEYLGGHRFPLSIHQVENNSEGANSFLGDLGAMSNTSDIHEDFIKSFEEHGYVIGVCVCRYSRNYSQGVERFWLRNTKEQFYVPVFANLGNQPVYLDEIYYDNGQKDVVFGYQEAWADYRYGRSLCTSEMRPGVANSLATWHLGDYYTQAPSLSDSWIREDKSNVDRVLSVQSSVAKQILADFYVKNIATRPMPLYSIPGLVDHH